MPEELNETRTKNDLERALRRLLEQKPLAQIRVRELTALCGIRRQSFYYHFSDVYALFDWSLGREAAQLAERQKLCLTWQQALTDLMRHIAQGRRYYQALLESRGRPGLRALLGEALEGLLSGTLDYYLRRCGAPRDPEQERRVSASWETVLLALLESWIQGDLAQPPEDFFPPLEALLRQGNVAAAWQNLSRGEP